MGGLRLSRRLAALVASVALLAGLATTVVVVPVAAADVMCGGQVATIVGTPGPDRGAGALIGTAGNDVIVGLGGGDEIDAGDGDDIICGGPGADHIDAGDGEDLVFGGGGADVIVGGGGDDDICGDAGNDTIGGDGGLGADGSDSIAGGPGRDTIDGGGEDDSLDGYRNALCTKRGTDVRDVIKGQSGNDTIMGGPGPDILKGGTQSDTIRGQSGNDDIDGGPASDDCRQGGGTGSIRRCEVADLVVVVIGPPSPANGATFKVRVRNRGPQASDYRLTLSEAHQHADCDMPWEGVRSFRPLGGGATRTRTYTIDCVIEDPGSWINVMAEVDPGARDPRPGNNEDSSGQVDLD